MKTQTQPTAATASVVAAVAPSPNWSRAMPNEINRYSVGTKNMNLKTNADGSLTIFVQFEAPAERTNWLPAPKGADFSLYLRTYWPKTAVIDGSWTPPAVEKQK